MDENGSLGGLCDGRHRAPEPLREPVEEEEVVAAPPFHDVVDAGQQLVDLNDAPRIEQWHSDHVHGSVVGLALVAEVDDPLDSVLGDGIPATVGEQADVIGANDHAKAGLGPVLDRQPAEVANVAAAFPREPALSDHWKAPRRAGTPSGGASSAGSLSIVTPATRPLRRKPRRSTSWRSRP